MVLELTAMAPSTGIAHREVRAGILVEIVLEVIVKPEWGWMGWNAVGRGERMSKCPRPQHNTVSAGNREQFSVIGR